MGIHLKDTIEGTIRNSDKLDGLHASSFQQQAHYFSENTPNGGYYKIKINNTDGWMMSFVINLYQSYSATRILVSGYNYKAINSWYAPNASIIDSSLDSINVKFGQDDAYHLWVAVPAGNYTGLTITDINCGFRNFIENPGQAFTIEYQSSLTGTVFDDITIYPPLKKNETATNADKLDGYHGDVGLSANTYVLRSGDGYTYHSYINSSTVNNENPNISQVIVTNGDNYYRKASLAHFKNQIGLGNYLPLTGGSMSGMLYANGGISVPANQSIICGSNNTSYKDNAITCGGEFRIYSEGNPGILTDGGLFILKKNVSGYSPVYASAFSSQSTRASKENFSRIAEEEALNLLKIPPMHFDYINGEKNQSGFIAEDVEPFFPEICSYKTDSETGEKKLFGLDYAKFSPYIVKFLQVLYEEMSALKRENDGLKNRIEKLEEYII